MKKPLLKIALGMATMAFGISSYAQTYSFTNCGATGDQGPTQGQVNAAYTSPDPLAGNVTINNQGIQEWTVPTTGTYTITAVGAQGGKPLNTGDSIRGGGATMMGDFMLTAGQVVKVVVGQEGIECTSGNPSNGGGRGGGGSFVWISTQSTPLVVAGGGGGGSITNTSGSINFCKGIGAPITNDGLPSHGQVSNFGTAGGDATQGSEPAKGWTSMFGALDFSGSTAGGHGGIGGFGGGGTGADATPHAGGGGGGYSGGGGGEYQLNSGSGNLDGRNGGGGGGSFNAGTNQSNTAGNNFGMGSVTIVYQVPSSITENDMFNGVNVYPNPTTNVINVSLNGLGNNTNLTLMSVDGRIVYQANNVSGNIATLDLSENSQGIYFLKVEANNQNKVYRVIKE